MTQLFASSGAAEQRPSISRGWRRTGAVIAGWVALAGAVAAPLRGAPGTQSGPIALTAGSQLLNVNSDANTVTIFDVTTDTPAKLAELAVGAKPVSGAARGNVAYVANAISGTVSVIDLYNRIVTKTIDVGKEPQAVALTPNGSRLYVANAASNTVSIIDTSTNTLLDTINTSFAGRSPNGLAITSDGDADDSDETVFVSMFLSELRPGKTTLDEGQDDQREGRVAALSTYLGQPLGAPNPVKLGPLASTGFNSNGQLAPAAGIVPAVASTNPQTFTTPTGAFPNQLMTAAVHPLTGRGYIVSTAASPNGPFRFNSMVQGLVSVFDPATRTEITSAQTASTTRQTAPLNLNQGINLGTTPAPRLFLSNPVAMTWRPDGSDAWVVIQNTDLLVRLTADGNGVPTIEAPLAAGPSSLVRVDLQAVSGGQIPGKAPRGLVINSAGTRAYVSNFVSRSVTVVNIATPASPSIAGTALSTALPAPGSLDETALLGAELFYTGRGPQGRMSSEGWGGCIVCHPNGRADGITWMFDAGPRQTIPLDSTFSKRNSADQRILNWSAVRDENHDFELNTRGVFGGRGLIDDDRLFFAIGGNANGTDSFFIEQFHQVTGSMTIANDLDNGATLPLLPGARRNCAVATLDDARVFIFGGRSGPGVGSLIVAADNVLEFNPRTNTLRRRSSTGFTPRHSLGAVAVRTSQGPRIYAVGGYAGVTPPTLPESLVQEYNPAADTWRTVAPLPTGVAQFGVAVAGGINTAEPRQLIHIVSGNAGTENLPLFSPAANLQRFEADPAGPGTWTALNVAGLTPRRNHGAAAALRGVQSRIFVIGGQDIAGAALDTVEEYQAQAATMVNSPHTSLPGPRTRFGIASSLSTNQIYIIGGMDAAGVDQAAIFEYTIAANGPTSGPAGTPSGAWVTRASLPVGRSGLGFSSPPGVTNFLTNRSSGRDPRQDAIATWIARSVHASPAPVSAANPAAVRGRALFGQAELVQAGFSCSSCHAGDKWTRSTVDYAAPPSPDNTLGIGNERVIGAELRQTATQGANVLINVGTFTLAGGRVNELRANGADPGQAINPLGANGFNIPSLLSVHETAPYFYSGTAATLTEVLDGSHDTFGGTRHHFVTDPAQRADLIEFLRSIDESTPVFPLSTLPPPALVSVKTGVAPGGGSQLLLEYLGTSGQTATLDTTTDLLQWRTFSTGTANASGIILFTPPLDFFRGFFRLRD